MRLRVTRPEFWESPKLAGLSWDARLMLQGLWSYVEDNGVGLASPGLMAAKLFPFDNPEGTIPRIAKAVDELCDRGLALRFSAEVDGFELALIEVTDWEQWQKPDRPSQARYPRSTSKNRLAKGSRVSRERRAGDSTKKPARRGEIGDRSSEIGDRRGEQSRETPARPTPPSRFCAKHPNGTESPCGPCKDARLEHERWERDHPQPQGADKKAMEWQAMKAVYNGSAPQHVESERLDSA